MIDLSIVIPVYNEEPNLAELHCQLTKALGGWGRTYEIIFVDDGSTDDSFAVLKKLQETDPHSRIIRFRRNFARSPRGSCHRSLRTA